MPLADQVWLCKVAERQMLRPSFVLPRPIRQLDAVHARLLAGLSAAAVPRLLAGTETVAFVDIDGTIQQVDGYAKQGAAYGYCGVKGLNAQIAAPVLADLRPR